jgi:hypothetical protein
MAEVTLMPRDKFNLAFTPPLPWRRSIFDFSLNVEYVRRRDPALNRDQIF